MITTIIVKHDNEWFLRRSHLSNATCLTQVFFKSGEDRKTAATSISHIRQVRS